MPRSRASRASARFRPTSFREFIGENIRLDKVRITKDDPIHDLLEFYMGKNTYERQGFIIDNLRIEEDIVEQESRNQLSNMAEEKDTIGRDEPLNEEAPTLRPPAMRPTRPLPPTPGQGGQVRPPDAGRRGRAQTDGHV